MRIVSLFLLRDDRFVCIATAVILLCLPILVLPIRELFKFGVYIDWSNFKKIGFKWRHNSRTQQKSQKN